MSSRPPTGIGRPLDLGHPSNRFVVVASSAAGVIGGAVGLVAGDGVTDAALGGAAVAVAVFLAWALARELDPDRPWTAGVAGVGAGLLVLSGRPALAQVALLMIVARFVNRSTGLTPTIVDRAVVAAGAGYVASTAGGFPVALVSAAMIAVGGHLPGGSRAREWWTAAAVGAAALAGAGLGGTWVPDPVSPDGGDLPAVIVGGLAILGLVRKPSVTARADRSPETLQAGRVWAARVGVALAAVFVAVWSGGDGLVGHGGTWVALAAAALPGVRGPTS